MVIPGKESSPWIHRLYFFLLLLLNHNYSSNYNGYNIRPPFWSIKEKVPIEIRSAKVIPAYSLLVWILITFQKSQGGLRQRINRR